MVQACEGATTHSRIVDIHNLPQLALHVHGGLSQPRGRHLSRADEKGSNVQLSTRRQSRQRGSNMQLSTPRQSRQRGSNMQLSTPRQSKASVHLFVQPAVLCNHAACTNQACTLPCNSATCTNQLQVTSRHAPLRAIQPRAQTSCMPEAGMHHRDASALFTHTRHPHAVCCNRKRKHMCTCMCISAHIWHSPPMVNDMQPERDLHSTQQCAVHQW
jgi:hypothetical protein